jgi:hypothetical protein
MLPTQTVFGFLAMSRSKRSGKDGNATDQLAEERAGMEKGNQAGCNCGQNKENGAYTMLLKHSGSKRGHLMPSATTRIRLLQINAVLLLCCSRVSAVEIPKDFQQMIVSIEVPSSSLFLFRSC